MDNRPVGVFDSGVGGVSVLNRLVSLLPREDFLFYGDNGNAPYGERTLQEICTLSLSAVEHLVRQNVKAIVIACNTASSVATAMVRATYALPVVAMEPAIRPASHLRKEGKVMVLATNATLTMERYHRRVAELNLLGETIDIPCPSFVQWVEDGVTDPNRWMAEIRRMLLPYREEQVDAIVLGCTHFLHIKHHIARVAGDLFPSVSLLDGNEGTAQQLTRILTIHDLCADRAERGSVSFQTSGNPDLFLPRMKQLFTPWETTPE